MGSEMCIRDRPQAVGDQIDRFSGAPSEDNVRCTACMKEFSGPLPGRLVGKSGAVAELMNAAVNIRMVLLVISLDGLDYLIGFLAACGIVEIDQWMSIDGLFQNGEVMPEMLHQSRVSLAQGARIEEGGFPYIKPS